MLFKNNIVYTDKAISTMPHALFIPWGVNNAQLLQESKSIRLCETPRSLREYILMFMKTIFVQLDHFIAMILVILQFK